MAYKVNEWFQMNSNDFKDFEWIKMTLKDLECFWMIQS